MHILARTVELQLQILQLDFQMHKVMTYFFLQYLQIELEQLRLEHRVQFIHLQMQIHFILRLGEHIKQLQILKVILLELNQHH